MIITGEPVAGVKMMRVNKDAKIDTVNYTNNRKDFVDSALTDGDGEYFIDHVKPGNYGIVPVYEDSTEAYRFSPAGESESYEFSLNGETRAVNFKAEKLTTPGAESGYFTIKVF